MFKRARITVLMSAVLMSALANAVMAQSYPSRPVKLIVALAAGGGTDILARMVGQKLSEEWRQPVVIENRPGALGTLAAEYVLKQPHDGYTVLVSILGTLTISEQLMPKLPFDVYKDFAGVTDLAYTPFVWLVNARSPIKTFPEFVAHARNNVVPFGNAGPGSLQHLYGEMFNMKYKTRFQNVPYKGQGPALQDLVGGHIASLLGDVGGTKSQVDSGQLRPLVVTGTKRLASMPSVPTFAELGFPGYERGGWFGTWVAAGVDRQIIEKLARDFVAALRTPQVGSRIAELGWEVGGGSPEEFTRVWKETGAALKPVLEQVKVDLN
jgi:tripartite-type tricarboxylate transporter receptor subunit TctC